MRRVVRRLPADHDARLMAAFGGSDAVASEAVGVGLTALAAVGPGQDAAVPALDPCLACRFKDTRARPKSVRL